jgi:hypothetical protein
VEVHVQRALIALLLALLGGCATKVQTSVTAFHELTQPLSGTTFSIVPTKDMENSLEFKSYANLIKMQLESKGMQEAPFEKAKYGVLVVYGIDGGKQVVYSYPLYGQTGTGDSSTTTTARVSGNTVTANSDTTKTPTYGVVGSGTSTATLYKRYLNIDIVDIQKSTANKLSIVYEGKAVSTGTSGNMAPVMPAMIETVFGDFPGKSGATRTSSLRLAK